MRLNCFQAEVVIENLYKIFMKYESTLIEINPMAEDATGKGLCHYVTSIQSISQTFCTELYQTSLHHNSSHVFDIFCSVLHGLQNEL